MIEWLSNFGTGIPAWVTFFVILLVIAVSYWFFNAVYRLGRDVGAGREDAWKPLRNVIFKGLVLSILLWGFFGAMGPGTPPQELQSDIGAMEYVDQAPDMKTQEQIDKEAEARKDPFLKKQDQGFLAEKEEADAILDEARKRHQNQ